MKLKPLHDKVLVKRTDEEQTTPGGIVLPGSATEKPSQGEVVAVGPGKRQDNGEVSPMGVKVGDLVIFGQYGGNEVKIDGDEYLMLKKLSLIKTIGLLTSGPASILKIDAGKISKGSPADLTIIDIDKSWIVNGDKMLPLSSNSCFEGMPLQGKVLSSWKNGRKIY